MLELILALLNDPAFEDKDVTTVVCPLVSAATLPDVHQELVREGPQFELYYGVRDGYQILSLERHSSIPFYTDELRILISTADASCKALVFRKTL